MRFSRFRHNPILSVEPAEKLGDIIDLVYSPVDGDIRSIIVRDHAISGLFSGERVAAIASVIALGEDAVMVEHRYDLGVSNSTGAQSGIRLSQILGLNALTIGGRLLGPIEDAEIDLAGRRIIHYLSRPRHTRFENQMIAFALGDGIRIGPNLVIVPDHLTLPVAPESSSLPIDVPGTA